MSAPKRAAAPPRRKTASAAKTKTKPKKTKPKTTPRKKPAPKKPKPAPRTNSAHHTPARPRRRVRRKLDAAAPRAIKIAPPPRAADPFAKTTGARRNYYTAEFLAEAKRRIETTLQSITAIAAELGMDKSVLWRLARSQGWVRPPGALRLRTLSPALRLAAHADALVAAIPPPGGGRACPGLDPGSPTAGRREGVIAERAHHPTPALTDVRADPPPPGEGGTEPAAPPSPDTAAIDRLEAAVLQELGTVETMRANLGKEPQRPIDAERTARTLSVLTETFAKLRRQRLAIQPQPDQAHDDYPADDDEFRNEFARRLRAFVASRTGGGGASGTGPAEGGAAV